MTKRNTELYLAGFLILFFVFLDTLHVTLPWIKAPPDHHFAAIAHFAPDYFLYTSHIAQGIEGHFFFADHRFTNEPLPPTWVYWFNVTLGNIGSIVTHNPFAIYAVSLFVFLLLLGGLWYLIIRKIFPSPLERVTALIFIFSASNFIDLRQFFSTNSLQLANLFWFTPTPALNRLGGVPHQIFQTILYLLLLLALSSFFEKNSKNFSIIHYSLFIILVFLAVTANPIQMVVFLCAAWTFEIWEILKNGLRVTEVGGPPRRGPLAGFLGGKLPTGPAHLVLFMLTAVALLGAWITTAAFHIPTLTAAQVWENTQQVSISIIGFLVATGPVGLLAIVGIKKFWEHPTHFKTLYFLFGSGALLLFFSPIPRILGTANSRYLGPASYGLLPILGTFGVITIFQWFNRVLKSKGFHHSLFFIHYSLFCIYLLLTIPALWVQINERINPQINPIIAGDLNYIPKDVMMAMNWLKSQPEDTQPVVVTDPALPYDVLIPTLAAKHTFTGHILHTLYPQTKEKLREELFSGSWSAYEIKQFFLNHRIGFLLIKTTSSNIFLNRYPFLLNRYHNETITILQVAL